MKTYSELIKIPSFIERFRYLKLNGIIGESTFGFERYLNQRFYRTTEWRNIRRHVILRDRGRDLAHEDYEIPNGVRIIIHHMNPISVKDITHKDDWILDPEYLICVTKQTHDAIHYGDEELLVNRTNIIVRTSGDTCPWKK